MMGKYSALAKHIAFAIPKLEEQSKAIESALAEMELASIPPLCERHQAFLKLEPMNVNEKNCIGCRVEDEVVRKAKEIFGEDDEGWYRIRTGP